MHFLSWNVAGRKGKLGQQARAIAERRPDVLALQEIRRETLPIWKTKLQEMGLSHLAHSEALLHSRRYFNVIASQWELSELPPLPNPEPEEEFHPERYVGAVVGSPFGPLEVHNAHLPPGSTRGLIKVRMFEALWILLSRDSERPRVLCGDFNTPQSEDESGEVLTWADRHPAHRKRWDCAERKILCGLADWDLPDLFRQLNGYGPREASWVLKRHGHVTPRRFDHIFASGSLKAKSCEYIHEWRMEGLSDHSAIEAEFAPG